jgi:hypothetical protein
MSDPDLMAPPYDRVALHRPRRLQIKNALKPEGEW